MWRALFVFFVASVCANDRPRGEVFHAALDGHETNRYRLTVFFEKYDPAMVEQVDYALEEWEGMEDQMWTKLEKAYGPENFHQREVTMARGRALLTRFYEAQSPVMVSDVDYVLQEYEGQFNMLDAQLRKKYGSGFLKTHDVRSTKEGSEEENYDFITFLKSSEMWRVLFVFYAAAASAYQCQRKVSELTSNGMGYDNLLKWTYDPTNSTLSVRWQAVSRLGWSAIAITRKEYVGMDGAVIFLGYLYSDGTHHELGCLAPHLGKGNAHPLRMMNFSVWNVEVQRENNEQVTMAFSLDTRSLPFVFEASGTKVLLATRYAGTTFGFTCPLLDEHVFLVHNSTDGRPSNVALAHDWAQWGGTLCSVGATPSPPNATNPSPTPNATSTSPSTESASDIPFVLPWWVILVAALLLFAGATAYWAFSQRGPDATPPTHSDGEMTAMMYQRLEV